MKLKEYHYTKQNKEAMDKHKREEMKRDNALEKGYKYYINEDGNKVYV
ncbi:hypothetical protein OGY35_23910 [Citrobacter sp. Ct235]|nr:hypothetical protein [Citrobacter sp. Ct235]MDM2738402.1 hypothetical protein [Citrobacter sp. Ct235]